MRLFDYEGYDTCTLDTKETSCIPFHSIDEYTRKFSKIMCTLMDVIDG